MKPIDLQINYLSWVFFNIKLPNPKTERPKTKPLHKTKNKLSASVPKISINYTLNSCQINNANNNTRSCSQDCLIEKLGK